MNKLYAKYLNAFKFRLFEQKIFKETWSKHEEILSWAEEMVLQSNDALKKEANLTQDSIVLKAISR